MRLWLAKMGTRWWILGFADYGPVGSYGTKAEAESDRIGMIRFIRHQNEPGYVTSTTCKGIE